MTFAWDNKNKNNKNPHLNFSKGTALEDKDKGQGSRVMGHGSRVKGQGKDKG